MKYEMNLGRLNILSIDCIKESTILDYINTAKKRETPRLLACLTAVSWGMEVDIVSRDIEKTEKSIQSTLARLHKAEDRGNQKAISQCEDTLTMLYEKLDKLEKRLNELVIDKDEAEALIKSLTRQDYVVLSLVAITANNKLAPAFIGADNGLNVITTRLEEATIKAAVDASGVHITNGSRKWIKDAMNIWRLATQCSSGEFFNEFSYRFNMTDEWNLELSFVKSSKEKLESVGGFTYRTGYKATCLVRETNDGPDYSGLKNWLLIAAGKKLFPSLEVESE